MLNKSLIRRFFAAKYDLAIIGGGPGVPFFKSGIRRGHQSRLTRT